MTERVFIGLGANLGDRRAQLEEALRRVGALEGTTVVAVARIIETPAMVPPEDPRPQPPYLNTVAELRTSLEPVELLRALKGVEREMGRTVTTRWAPRLIDLDVLLYGSRVLQTPELELPHPGIAEREFVLWPLRELWPDAVDPRTSLRLDLNR